MTETTEQLFDLLDVTDMTCCICFEPFHNGQTVYTLSCGGAHLMCDKCLKVMMEDYEDEFRCPVCCGDTHVSNTFRAQNYYKGSGKDHDPIIINDLN
jgi:zinc-RING finger domain